MKLHRLLSRHSTPVKLLPPKLRSFPRKTEDTEIALTPALEAAMVGEFRPSLEILRGAGKLGALLLQLSPSFSPRKHKLEELEHLFSILKVYPVALEFRNRHWFVGRQSRATLDFVRGHDAALVLVDAPEGEHFTILPSQLNEITNPRLAYLRLHGRNAQAYLKGRTVATRFDYDYSDEEIAEVGGASSEAVAFRAGGCMWFLTTTILITLRGPHCACAPHWDKY